MLDHTSLIYFLVATVALNVTPGPDMLYIIARSLGQGQKAGIVSALGICVGCLVHTLAAAFGLSALLKSSATAFEVIKYLGAVYLIYLGIRLLLSKNVMSAQARLKPASLGSIFRQGVMTNVLNPKVALFFLAFLPQFVNASKGAVAWQIIFLGLIFNTSGTIWNSAVAMLAGYVGNQFKERPSLAHLQRWLTGSIFIGLGVRLALTKRS